MHPFQSSTHLDEGCFLVDLEGCASKLEFFDNGHRFVKFQYDSSSSDAETRLGGRKEKSTNWPLGDVVMISLKCNLQAIVTVHALLVILPSGEWHRTPLRVCKHSFR